VLKNPKCANAPDVPVVGLQHDTSLRGVGSNLELVEISQQFLEGYLATVAWHWASNLKF
jgi:hypothetical protein